MGYYIKEMTYSQLEPLITEDTVIILPIGGGSKEHGNHLPMGTDYYVTDWIASQVTEKCEVLTLPTLPYAYFPAFVEWKGSVSIEHKHFTNYVQDILKSFIKFGVWKFLIIDGGVSTHPALCMMARDMLNKYNVKVAVSDITQLAKETEESICSQERGGHGDEAETSTMLYIREDLVHMEQSVEEYMPFIPGNTKRVKVYVPDLMNTPHGVNGNSTLATKEKGKKILEASVKDICTFLDAFTAMKKSK